jgi:hypothetical protein
MSANDEISFEERLGRAICSAYDLGELTQMVGYRLNERLETIAPPNARLDLVVFSLIEWARRKDRLGNLTRSAARYLEDRGGKNATLCELVVEVEALQPPAPQPPATSGAPELPEDLLALIEAYDRIPRLVLAGTFRSAQMEQTAAKIRPLIQTSFNLPQRMHLSESAGQRLAAVLALQQFPDPLYLRWLSERVSVEPEPVGYLAATALVRAAFQLPQNRFASLKTAVQEALERLSGASDPLRRQNQLEEALSITRCREGNLARVPTLSFDNLCTALTNAFTRNGRGDLDSFQELAIKVGLRLERVVRLTEPFEYVVFRLIKLAYLEQWDHELITQARMVRPGCSGLDQVFGLYVEAGALSV